MRNCRSLLLVSLKTIPGVELFAQLPMPTAQPYIPIVPSCHVQASTAPLTPCLLPLLIQHASALSVSVIIALLASPPVLSVVPKVRGPLTSARIVCAPALRAIVRRALVIR